MLRNRTSYKFLKLILLASLAFAVSPGQPLPADDERTIEILRKRLRIEPKDPQLLFKLGWYMQKKNFLDFARIYYKKCLVVDDKHVSAHINLANILQKQGKYAPAERHYLKAIKLRPNSALAHYNVGTLYLAQKRRSRSILSFQKTVELRPAHKAAHLNLSSIYLKMFREKRVRTYWKYARDHLIKAARIDRRYAPVYFNLGKLYELDNQISIAIQYYREAVRYYRPSAPFRKKAHKRIVQLKAALRKTGS